jgi:lipopolysaccharide export system protein LptA
MKPKPSRTALMCAALLLGTPALAERADRDKPITLEADRVTVDDRNKIHTYAGNVTLTQGTMVIRTDRLVVSQDTAGFFKGVATGGPGGLARIRQKREGRDEYMDGEAERIEHDGNSERTQFFNRAYIKSGQDEVRGQYIVYDALSENYTVTSGPDGTVAKPRPGQDTRVRVVIQPRNKDTSGRPEAPRPTEPGASAPDAQPPNQENRQ